MVNSTCRSNTGKKIGLAIPPFNQPTAQFGIGGCVWSRDGHEVRRDETRRVGCEASQCNTQLARLVYYTTQFTRLVARMRQLNACSPRLAMRRGELMGYLVLAHLTRQNIWHSGCKVQNTYFGAQKLNCMLRLANAAALT